MLFERNVAIAEWRECRIARPPTDKEGDTPKFSFTSLDLSKNPFFFELSESEPKLKNDWDTKSQFKRAALSTMNNIAEGFGRGTRKEFARFLDIAQSSAREVKSMTYVFEDLNYTTLDKIKELHEKTDAVMALTLGFIKHLKKKLITFRRADLLTY